MNLFKQLFFILIALPSIRVYAMDAPNRKRKASEISHLSAQDYAAGAARATIDLINLLEVIGASISQAQEKRNLEKIQYFLDRGANPNARNDVEEPALLLASETGRLEIVRLMLEYGADPDAQSPEQGESALHFAVASGNNLNLIQILLAAGANPNLQNVNGDTPLLIAFNHIPDRRGHKEEIVRLLLQAGANPMITNADGQNALMILNGKLNQSKEKPNTHQRWQQIQRWIQHPETMPKAGFEKIK